MRQLKLLPKATSPAKSPHSWASELVKRADGVFDAAANGMLIYSKHSAGRIPEHAEVLQALRGLPKS